MITLRPARPADADAIAAIYAPHVLAGVASFETEPPDPAAMRARMATAGALYPWLVACRDEEEAGVLGYAYAARFREREAYRWVAETTVYLAEDAQGRGIGRRLYAALIATLAAQGFAQAIGTIALPNDASVALHETLGFHCAGLLRSMGWKHGRWIDIGYWQRALAGDALPPEEPKRFAEVGLIESDGL